MYIGGSKWQELAVLPIIYPGHHNRSTSMFHVPFRISKMHLQIAQNVNLAIIARRNRIPVSCTCTSGSRNGKSLLYCPSCIQGITTDYFHVSRALQDFQDAPVKGITWKSSKNCWSKSNSSKTSCHQVLDETSRPRVPEESKAKYI